MIHHEITWYECKSQPGAPLLLPCVNVIHHEITWYECKSQPLLTPSLWLIQCDSSRNYLIRMQITTISPFIIASGAMWFITKLLDTNANHNIHFGMCGTFVMWFITKLLDTNANHNESVQFVLDFVNVIHHEITWYECKSQPRFWNPFSPTECDSSRNYLIRMQITTGT